MSFDLTFNNGKERASEQAKREYKSILSLVLEQISSKKDIFIAGVIIDPNHGSGWTETVDVIVAPVKPIYNANKLNEFMNGIIERINPTCQDLASFSESETNFRLGKLYFDETIGVVQSQTFTNTIAYDEQALQRCGLTAGESHSTEERHLRRRTWVRVYPDALVAEIAATYERGTKDGSLETNEAFEYLKHWITKEQLNALKYNKNPFLKNSGLLKG